MSEPRVFPCERCGACCRQVTAEFSRISGLPLHGRGKGCAHQMDDNTCSIYAERPDICRVKDRYILNNAVCAILREREALA